MRILEPTPPPPGIPGAYGLESRAFNPVSQCFIATIALLESEQPLRRIFVRRSKGGRYEELPYTRDSFFSYNEVCVTPGAPTFFFLQSRFNKEGGEYVGSNWTALMCCDLTTLSLETIVASKDLGSDRWISSLLQVEPMGSALYCISAETVCRRNGSDVRYTLSRIDLLGSRRPESIMPLVDTRL